MRSTQHDLRQTKILRNMGGLLIASCLSVAIQSAFSLQYVYEPFLKNAHSCLNLHLFKRYPETISS